MLPGERQAQALIRVMKDDISTLEYDTPVTQTHTKEQNKPCSQYKDSVTRLRFEGENKTKTHCKPLKEIIAYSLKRTAFSVCDKTILTAIDIKKEQSHIKKAILCQFPKLIQVFSLIPLQFYPPEKMLSLSTLLLETYSRLRPLRSLA